MAFAKPNLDVDIVLTNLERKLLVLEEFATTACGGDQKLPALPAIREFRNDRAMYNAVESTLLRLEKVAASVPRTANTGRSHIQAKVIDYDPGEVFSKELEPFLAKVIDSANSIGKLTKKFGAAATILSEQAAMLGSSVTAEAELISKASKMPKPGDPAVLKAECQALVDASADTADFKYSVDVRCPLHDHVMALADTSAALGWVVAPAPLKHIRDYRQIVRNLTEGILARYIELGCDPVHPDFAEALNSFMDSIVKYVEKEHPAGLRWNYAQGATPLGYRRVKKKVSKNAHPIADYFVLMHGALTVYVLASREIGGIVAKHADAILSVYYEMLKVIESASNSIRPSAEGGGGELKMLLMSVQHELVPLVDSLRSVSEDDRYYHHCVAVQEFIGVMQWCTATLNKMSPVTYIIDIENLTNKCLNRVEEEFCNGTTYKSQLHHRWVESIRQMLSELKEYVKTHHPNELMFDTRRSRRSVDKALEKSSLSKQIQTLKDRSSTKKWVLRNKTKRASGKSKQVRVWCRL